MKIVSKIRILYLLLSLVALALVLGELILFEWQFYISLLSAIAILLTLLYELRLARKVQVVYHDMLNKIEEIKDNNFNNLLVKFPEGELQEIAVSINDLLKEINRLQAEVHQKVQDETKKIRMQQREIKEKNSLLEDTKIAMLNLLEDIEEEKELAQAERDRTGFILESINDGVLVIDKKKKVVLFNSAASGLTNIKQNVILNTDFTKHLKFLNEEEDIKAEGLVVKALKNHVVSSIDSAKLHILREGIVIDVYLSTAPVLDNKGEVLGCVVVFRDITEEKAIDKAKTEFVSLASHQLRTPLTTIKWYIASVLGGDAGKISVKQKQYLDQVYNGSQRLITLVDSLLNVSRLELGTFFIKPIKTDIKDIINKVFSSLKVLISEKEIKFSVDIERSFPDINLDPNLMLIIVQNLLANAVKYCGTNGIVKVIVKKSNNKFEFIVKDNGIGIPKRQQSRIFEKLFRADNVRKLDTEGTGLGLYIVKRIVEESGGQINFSSIEGKGSTFIVQYPIRGMKKKEGEKELIIKK